MQSVFSSVYIIAFEPFSSAAMERNNRAVQAMLAANGESAEERDGASEPQLVRGGGYVVSLIENRAKEVGIASLELESMKLSLVQFVEASRGYSNTQTMLEVFPPSQLLVVGTKDDSVEAGINNATQGFEQTPLPRALFDDTKGLLMVSKCASPETRAELENGVLHSSIYLALGAAGALLRYLEQEKSLLLVAGSLTVQFVSSQHHMHIDLGSMQSLELIQPSKVGSTASKKGNTSLFRLLDRTKTRAGARLLRANLLQPLRDIATLNLRFDCIEELLARDELLHNIGSCLTQLPPDLDRVCGSLSIKPAKSDSSTLRRIAGMINSMILLRELLQVLPPLAEMLEPAECQLLRTIGATCGHSAFGDLLQLLNGALEEDVQSAKNSFLNRTQQCFAVKGGVDGFLDIARQNFCRVTEQVHQLSNQYHAEHNLPNMRIHYTTKRGFYLIINNGPTWGKRRQEEPEPSASMQEHSMHTAGGSRAPKKVQGPGAGGPIKIPPGFSVLQNNGRSVQCTSNELNALNARLRDASNDCIVLTEQVLDGLADRIVEAYLPLLHRLVDNLALLDMLLAFAQLAATSSGQYVRPVLTQAGPIAIVEGRHPILEQLEQHQYQPNDTYLALSSSFHIIAGPNMSGKSTYLKQVALVVIMAQVGCFVPAAFASITPVDRLFTRMGTGDCLETNSSSFMVEMQETAYILNHATARSLVLIDELGRATSTADGAGIAWAVSEHLIALGTPTLFATHFPQLAELAAIYPNCRAWHLDVDTSRNKLDFSWRLKAGCNDTGHYGLLLAKAVGFSLEVLDQAARIVTVLEENEEQRIQTYTSSDHSEQCAVFSVMHKLLCVAQSHSSSGDARALQKQLKHLKQEAAGLLTKTQPAALQGL